MCDFLNIASVRYKAEPHSLQIAVSKSRLPPFWLRPMPRDCIPAALIFYLSLKWTPTTALVHRRGIFLFFFFIVYHFRGRTAAAQQRRRSPQHYFILPDVHAFGAFGAFGYRVTSLSLLSGLTSPSARGEGGGVVGVVGDRRKGRRGWGLRSAGEPPCDRIRITRSPTPASP